LRRTCVTSPFWPLARAAVLAAYDATDTPVTPAMAADLGGGGEEGGLAVPLADPRRVAAYGPQWALRVAPPPPPPAAAAPSAEGGAGAAAAKRKRPVEDRLTTQRKLEALAVRSRSIPRPPPPPRTSLLRVQK
jgi:hypothetical protein